jgi:hypothetical protein
MVRQQDVAIGSREHRQSRLSQRPTGRGTCPFRMKNQNHGTHMMLTVCDGGATGPTEPPKEWLAGCITKESGCTCNRHSGAIGYNSGSASEFLAGTLCLACSKAWFQYLCQGAAIPCLGYVKSDSHGGSWHAGQRDGHTEASS